MERERRGRAQSCEKEIKIKRKGADGDGGRESFPAFQSSFSYQLRETIILMLDYRKCNLEVEAVLISASLRLAISQSVRAVLALCDDSLAQVKDAFFFFVQH